MFLARHPLCSSRRSGSFSNPADQLCANPQNRRIRKSLKLNVQISKDNFTNEFFNVIIFRFASRTVSPGQFLTNRRSKNTPIRRAATEKWPPALIAFTFRMDASRPSPTRPTQRTVTEPTSSTKIFPKPERGSPAPLDFKLSAVHKCNSKMLI